MLLSIITINYNDKAGLARTMDSVLSQTYTDFEYIVIDGGSTDGSKAVIEQRQSQLAYWVSEPDTGIYNAMNKGIKQAKGDYLLFLNSGDTLYANDTLKLTSLKISKAYSIYYGDVIRHYADRPAEKKIYPKVLSFGFFVDSALAHQTTFIKRELFYRYFLYSENLKILSDWEFIIYAICKKNEPYKHLELVIANYDMNGISSQLEGREIMLKERELTYQKYFPLFVDDYKPLINKAKENLLKANNSQITTVNKDVTNQPNRLRRAYGFFKKGLKVLIKQ